MQRQSKATCSNRRSLYPRSFHLSFLFILKEWNVHLRPCSNKRHVPLAIKHCLDNGRDSMFILLDKSFKNKSLHAMDMPKATTLEIKQGSLNEHVANSHILSLILGSP